MTKIFKEGTFMTHGIVKNSKNKF